MGITDYQHQKEIVNEVITLVTVNRTEKGQYIKIYNKLESKPEVYLNKSLTRKKEIFHLLNDEEAIDISDEFKRRYIRTNR